MTQLSTGSLDLKKAGQLIYFFLDHADRRGMHITKLRLIKWIYIAERESYREFGEPLIGDKLCSLKHGPVPSETLAMIEGKKLSTWSNIFLVYRQNKHQYLQIAKNCLYSNVDNLDRFSEAEIQVLESVWEKYGSWSSKRLETHLHDKSEFPEWVWKTGDGTNWIELETILESVGFTADQVPQMVEKIIAFNSDQLKGLGQ